MTVKAKLKVRLVAEETVVAESDDPILWQRILSEITRPKSGEAISVDAKSFVGSTTSQGHTESTSHRTDDPVSKFAEELGVTVPELQGALSPSETEPYMHLTSKYWEQFKRNTPARGEGSVSNIAFAGTALALWAKHAKDIPQNRAVAETILDTINIRDSNPDRGLKNCDWLLYRDKKITINPAEYTKAVKVIRAYCKKSVVDAPQE